MLTSPHALRRHPPAMLAGLIALGYMSTHAPAQCARDPNSTGAIADPDTLAATLTTVCAGSPTTFSATVGTGGDALEWFDATNCGGSPVAGQSPTVSPTATTTYSVRSVDTSTGCVSGCQDITITVNALPVANAGADFTYELGDTINLAGLPNSMTTYAWTGPDSFSSSVQSPQVTTNATLATAGTYALMVTEDHGPAPTCTASDSVVVSLAEVDLLLTKEVDSESVVVGSSVTYTITVSNIGTTGKATGIEVTDILPQGVSFEVGDEAATDGSVSCDTDTSRVVWSGFDLAEGESATLTLLVRVSSGGVITNTASMSAADQGDPNSVNNQDFAEVTGFFPPPPPPPPPLPDLPANCIADAQLDLADYAVFRVCMSGPGVVGCECADVDGDGDVDLYDFAEMQAAFTGPSVPGPICGNGLLESGETCDDGNTDCGDGCDANCQLEPGFCGDGILDWIIEECDDGNTVPGDGCDENCQIEPGVCGDGILSPGSEECDDGNTSPGDGCDENCLLERPANDDCVDAIAVFDGDTNFNNLSASTDGPDEPGVCDFGIGTTQVDADVWFCYEATCSGTVTASLCGSGYDTKLAVYDGCACPPTSQALACSDDDCGAGAFDSRLTFNATQGQSYSIRIGGFTIGSQGTGILALRCDVQPLCDVAAGDCFAAGGNGSPGCDDPTCCETTCAADPFCCDVTWDSNCAAEAQGLCTGSFPACSTSTGDCAADNAVPGCDDESCCNLVCAIDPFCCADTWDEFCASEAAGICGFDCGTTGAPRNNACDEVAVPGVTDPVAGCSDEATCKSVCTIAPECCLEEWGQKCVCLADPSDPCCVAVCNSDPFCCSTEWDSLCDDAAASLCP